MVLKKIKWTWKVASLSYIEWLFSTRSVLMIMILIFITDDTVLLMISLSEQTGYLLNLFEPFTVICNDMMNVVIISAGYVCLIAGFPQVGTSSQNMIYRISRTSWLFGQVLFSLLVGITYLGGILISSCLFSARQSFISNHWSNFTTLVPQNFPDIASDYPHHIVDVSVYSQINVFSAVAYGFIANIFFFLILALIAVSFTLSGKRFLGFVTCFGVIFAGLAFYMLGLQLQWLFPMSNSIFGAHMDLIFEAEVMPIWYSVLYFIIIILVLIMFSHERVKKFPINPMTE